MGNIVQKCDGEGVSFILKLKDPKVKVTKRKKRKKGDNTE